MLRGNFSAKIDDKGRLKVPTAFRSLIADKYGDAVYVTSLSGIEEKLADVPSTHPARDRFLDRVNYYGQTAEFDKQGRLSIHGRLRTSAEMVGEVDVFGKYDHLEVWNHTRFQQRLDGRPFTEDDARALSDFGI